MRSEMRCLAQLVEKELYLRAKTFKSVLLDELVGFCTWVLVFGYLSPSIAAAQFGPTIFVGSIASFGLFGTIWNATVLAQDVSDKKMNTYLILPMPTSYVFLGMALAWSIFAAAVTACFFPVGKFLLWNQLDLSHFSVWRCALIFVLSHLFYGFFALWISSLVTNVRHTSWIWSRVVNPLFMFSGYFYTWNEVQAMSPWLGALHLANPLLYVLEGTKVAFFGSQGFLPYSLSLGVIVLGSIVFAVDGVRRFKKRIDFV